MSGDTCHDCGTGCECVTCATRDQPAPKPNESRPVWELVIEDMHARDAMGARRYGTRLQAANGRNQLQDLYEELLDGAVYVKAALIEREALMGEIERLRTVADNLEDACSSLFYNLGLGDRDDWRLCRASWGLEPELDELWKAYVVAAGRKDNSTPWPTDEQIKKWEDERQAIAERDK